MLVFNENDPATVPGDVGLYRDRHALFQDLEEWFANESHAIFDFQGNSYRYKMEKNGQPILQKTDLSVSLGDMKLLLLRVGLEPDLVREVENAKNLKELEHLVARQVQ